MPSPKSQYRGYEIRLRQEWSNWCANVHPIHAELPLLAQSPLNTLSVSPEEAIASAKHTIDEALSEERRSFF